MSLSGQWVGRYSGSNSGTLVIEIDDAGDHYEGVACVWDDNAQLPSSLVRFQTSSKANSHRLDDLPNVPMNAAGYSLPENALRQLAANEFRIAGTVNVEVELQGKNLSVK